MFLRAGIGMLPRRWGGHRNVLLSGTVMVRSMDFATYLVKNYELGRPGRLPQHTLIYTFFRA